MVHEVSAVLKNILETFNLPGNQIPENFHCKNTKQSKKTCFTVHNLPSLAKTRQAVKTFFHRHSCHRWLIGFDSWRWKFNRGLGIFSKFPSNRNLMTTFRGDLWVLRVKRLTEAKGCSTTNLRLRLSTFTGNDRTFVYLYSSFPAHFECIASCSLMELIKPMLNLCETISILLNSRSAHMMIQQSAFYENDCWPSAAARKNSTPKGKIVHPLEPEPKAANKSKSERVIALLR